MSIPTQRDGSDPSVTGFPANELERVLVASLGHPEAGPRLLETLARSSVWIPLPNGGSPDSADLDLPTIQLGGVPYVPVFSSEEQFLKAAGGLSFAVAPMHEFARGLPPQVGIAVNPDGAVGVPVPPEAVLDLCRGPVGDPREAAGAPTGHDTATRAIGARVRMWEPDPDIEPVDFLATAAGEFAVTPVVLTARRALASIEGDDPVLFVGVELDSWQDGDRAAATDALGRALGIAPVPWAVNLVLLDIAQDPVGDWMLDRVEPFFARD